MNIVGDCYEQIEHQRPQSDILSALDFSAAEATVKTELDIKGICAGLGISNLFLSSSKDGPRWSCTVSQRQFHYKKDLFSADLPNQTFSGLTPESTIILAANSYFQEHGSSIVLRGSFNELKSHHVLLNPAQFLGNFWGSGVTAPLLWTAAVSLKLESEILIPADWVFKNLNHLFTKTKKVPLFFDSFFGSASNDSQALCDALISLASKLGFSHLSHFEKVRDLAIAYLNKFSTIGYRDLILVNLSRNGLPLKMVKLIPVLAP